MKHLIHFFVVFFFLAKLTLVARNLLTHISV